MNVIESILRARSRRHRKPLRHRFLDLALFLTIPLESHGSRLPPRRANPSTQHADPKELISPGAHRVSCNLPHTILRNGPFVFNRRVPEAVAQDFGPEIVRIKLGKDVEQARGLAERQTQGPDEIGSSPRTFPVEGTLSRRPVTVPTASHDRGC